MPDRLDPDGVRHRRRGRSLWLRAAGGCLLVALVGAGGVLALRPEERPAGDPGPSPAVPPGSPAPRLEEPPPLPRDPAERAMLKALQQANAAGERTIRVEQLGAGDGGIYAFPRPGTKPVRGGLLVPDDYVLPPGFVRHVQTTDDGRQLPPILTFHPDFHPTDAQGRPVEVPPDRIVPPELAPPDLPQRWFEPPQERKEP